MTQETNSLGHYVVVDFTWGQHSSLSCFQEIVTAGCGMRIPSPSTPEKEAGGSRIWGQSSLHSKYQASLDYLTRPCLKKTKSKQTNKQTQNIKTTERLSRNKTYIRLLFSKYRVFKCARIKKEKDEYRGSFACLLDFSGLVLTGPQTCFSPCAPFLWLALHQAWNG
jgi:hypothetical protein